MIECVLVAYMRLYKSVGPSVCPSVTMLELLPKGYLNHIKVPAHPYATDAVVYTALLFIFSVAKSNSTREFVRPWIRWSVGFSVHQAFLKKTQIFLNK